MIRVTFRSVRALHYSPWRRLPKRQYSDLANMAVINGTAKESKPLDILLIGLGSIGSVYAYILERVGMMLSNKDACSRQSGRARVTAVARSNYKTYTSGQVTLDTERFGKHPGWKPYRGRQLPHQAQMSAAESQVVKSQAEALEGDVKYDLALIATKCLPDVLPTPKLAEEAIQSGKVAAWSLIQVSCYHVHELMGERSRGRGRFVPSGEASGYTHHIELRLDRNHDLP